jgi:hypothetical protein
MSDGAAAEGEALSVDTAPLCLPFFENKSASGFRTFDFDIRIQHFRFTPKAIEYGTTWQTRQAGKCCFAAAIAKLRRQERFYMSEAM